MSYADQQQMTGGKIAGLVIAVALNVGLILALVFGLTISAVKEQIERVTTVNVEEEPPPPPDEPPPPPEEQPQPTSPPPPMAPPPPFDIAPNPPVMETTPNPPPPQPTVRTPSIVAPPGPPTPPRPPSKARGARTKNERSWAARIQENYPARALREEIEGTVGVRVTVTAEGRATNCSVTASSGSDILDAAACSGMERYSRFEPALDDAGNPTSGNYTTRITYRLN